jgi:hypothetical protein
MQKSRINTAGCRLRRAAFAQRALGPHALLLVMLAAERLQV